MYQVAVQKKFIARHYLTGGDWGEENQVHSHNYLLELILVGLELDQHGYLVDIEDIEENLLRVIQYFKDQILNDLPEFSGLNPSLEHFSRIIWENLHPSLQTSNIQKVIVKLWENDFAYATFEMGN